MRRRQSLAVALGVVIGTVLGLGVFAAVHSQTNPPDRCCAPKGDHTKCLPCYGAACSDCVSIVC